MIYIECPPATNDALARYGKNSICDAIRYCGHYLRGFRCSVVDGTYHFTVAYQFKGQQFEPLPEGFEEFIGRKHHTTPRVAQLMDEQTDPTREALGALSPSESKRAERAIKGN